MAEPRWMLYGANGYTGRLIAAEAVRRGMSPVLAGRTARAIAEVAAEHGLEHRVFGLDSPDTVAREVEPFDAVLLSAGPFSATSAPVVEACLQARTHYLDITGEIDVFERIFARRDEAERRGVSLVPGVGFDVVPTDCLAAKLAGLLPDATMLELAFHGGGGVSAGTLRTALERLPRGNAIRRAGRIEREPLGERNREVPFRDRRRTAMAIPWGDVSSAYHSTGIGDIVTYLALPPSSVRAVHLAWRMRGLLGAAPVQRALSRWAGSFAKGPPDGARETYATQLWGRVSGAAGNAAEGTAVTPQGYRLTYLAAVEAVHRVASGRVRPGALTPSMAFGAGFLEELPDCDVRVEQRKR